MARQTPQQYLAHNEHVIFDPSRTPVDSHDQTTPDINENGKRLRSPDRMKENGDLEGIHPAKRPHSLSPGDSNPRLSPGGGGYPATGGNRSPDSGLSRVDRDRYDRDRLDRDRHLSPYGYARSEHYEAGHFERIEDEWKHLENMLHCVMDMVGRCRQALTTLQERTRREREDLARWLRQHNGGVVDPEVKKRADYMTESLRHTEDRVTEVRRRAVHVFPEDAVNEVKRQAMIELQKAVSAAELKATELVAAERAKMEQAVSEARKQVRDEVMASLSRQEESTENCWNCGRQASETCSGCNSARYCGSFCQHKDWETHHRVCVLKATTKDHIKDTPRSAASSPKQLPSSSSTQKTVPSSPEAVKQEQSSPRENSAGNEDKNNAAAVINNGSGLSTAENKK